jgi:1-acyl-sn-glycerol-3-phosphate acyltransferase
MRRIWRLVRLVVVTIVRTLALNVAAWRRPPEQRAALRAAHQQTGTQRLCRILNVEVTVDGTIPARSDSLIVCNHLGILDPLILASQMPLAFAGRADLQHWPLIGWVCRTFGVVFVDRDRRTATRGFVQQVGEKLAHGVGVLVFPEGTTSKGERVRPFKTGAFEAVAGRPDASVLPLSLQVIAVDGHPADAERREQVTWADPAPSFGAHLWALLGLESIRVQVRLGTPIPTDGHDRKTLARRAHAQVQALYTPELAPAE